MKIAFVSVFDPQDVRRGSGTFYHLCRELESQGHIVHYVGPLSVQDEPLVTRFLRWLTKSVLHGRYITYLDPFIACKRGRMASRLLENIDIDIILTSDYGIAYGMATSHPVVIYTDAMLPVNYQRGEEDLHSMIAGIPSLIVPVFQFTIRRALERCALCIFPAEWQKRDALAYGVSTDKLRVIPFGANIIDPGSDMVKHRALLDEEGALHLLFVGKYWDRKGGDIAVKAAQILNDNGILTILHVVGVTLQDMPPFVRSYGLLNKNNAEENIILEKLYQVCGLLIFPSRSEGSAIAPREAAAYGIPTLAYRIPGLATSVIDGESGLLLPPGDTAEGFARAVRQLLEYPAEYERLSSGARTFYERSANWQTAGSQLVNEMLSLVVSR